MVFRLAALAALGLLGLPLASAARAEAAPPAAPEAEPTATLISVTIAGNRHVPKAAIMAALGLKEGQAVTSTSLREALDRVVAMGTFSRLTPRLEVTELGGIRLVVEVRENPVVSRIHLQSPASVDPGWVEPSFAALKGHVLSIGALRQALEQATKALDERGLVFGRVVPLKLEANGELWLEVREGKLDKVSIQGNQTTHEAVITRELSLRAGSIATREALQGDLARLQRLGYFDSVVPRARLDPDSGELELVWEVKERRTGRLSASGGWSTTEGPMASFSLGNENFLGRGQQFAASLMVSRLMDPAHRSVLTELSLMEPWLDEQHTSLGGALWIRRFLNPFARLPDGSVGLLETRGGASVTLGRPLFGDPVTTTWRGEVSLKAERMAIASPAGGRPTTPIGLTASGREHDWGFSAGLGVAVDRRDQGRNPHQGDRASLSLEQFLPPGDLRLSRLVLDAAHFEPVGGGTTLALGLRAGTNFGLFGAGVPPYQRFYSFSENLLRGWPDGESGGEHFVLLMSEWRIGLWGPLQGVVFGDTGCFLAAGNPSPWRSGYGVGLRMDSPLGLLRADYGLHRWGEMGYVSIGAGHRF